jgi:ribosomal protein S8E
MTWVAAGTAAVSVVGGLVSGSKARKAEQKAQQERDRIQRQMAAFEANRQDVINPYANVTSNAEMIDEMRGNLSNPFASLGVATQAAEIQMEQTDIALANTLDTLQATGASAGGATALAQAAKQSKKEVSANIEQQEAQNEKLRAQGEQELQAKEMQLSQMEMAESARVQSAQAQGQAFMFNAQENRDMATLDRMSGQESQARADIANAQTAQAAATGAMISGVSSAATGLLGSGAFAEGGSLNPPQG